MLPFRSGARHAPQDFEEYVQQQIKRLDELDLPDERWQFFAILAVAKGALTKEDIKAVTKMRDRQLRQMHLCWQVTRWMRITADNVYAFAHPLLGTTFAAHLGDEAEDALQDLIDYCSRWQKYQSHYALRYYPEHLQDEKRWEDLYKLLTHFEYIDTKISALGVQLLIEDYDFDFNPEYITTDKKVNFNLYVIKLIQGALRLSAHILAEDKTQLIEQLWGHLSSCEAPEIQEMLEHARQCKSTPWLRPLSSSFTTSSNSLQRTLEGHTDWISAVAVTADGADRNLVVSASYDHTLKVWDIASGDELSTLTGHTESVWAVAITADGKIAVSASDDCTLKVWDLASGENLKTLRGHDDIVRAVAVTVTIEGQWIVSGSRDCTLKVWDLANGHEIRTLVGHTDLVSAVAVTADGKLTISASTDGTIKVWDLASGGELNTFRGHSREVWAVAIAPHKQWIVSASDDHTLKVWDLASGRTLHTLVGHKREVRAVAVTADEKLVVSGSTDSTIKVWDLASGHEIRTLTGHSWSVTSVAITEDTRWLVSASADKTLKVWDLHIDEKLSTLAAHTDWVRSIAITADGKKAVSASNDCTLKVWDVVCSSQLYILGCHRDAVQSVSVTANGKFAISSSRDFTVKVWDLTSGQMVCYFKGDRIFSACAVAEDGVTIVAGDCLGHVHFLQLERV